MRHTLWSLSTLQERVLPVTGCQTISAEAQRGMGTVQ